MQLRVSFRTSLVNRDAGKSGACLHSALNLLQLDLMLSRCYFPIETEKKAAKVLPAFLKDF
jgi:hypothetical protein